MACSIVATAGASNANSYATIAEGDTYHETHLYGEDWDDASDDEQCRALQMATRLLDQWFDWYGTPSSDTQALRWPRSAAYDRDGDLLANDTVPQDIKYGTIELARQLITEDRTADSDNRGLKSLKAGTVEIQFSGSATKSVISDAAMSFVSHYGRKVGATGGGAVTLRRG